MHTVTLIVDAADHDAILDAIDLRLTFAAGLPDGEGNQTGRVVAEICRGWAEFLDAAPVRAGLETENERLRAQRDALAGALRNLLHDTAYGVFAQGPGAVRQAEAALALADEVTP